MIDIQPDVVVASHQNPRIKHAVHLRKRRYRDQTGESIIEGYRELLKAIENGHCPTELFYSPPLFLGVNEPILLQQARDGGARLIEVGPNQFAKISYRDRPDGLLGIAPRYQRSLEDLSLTSERLLFLVAEAVEKPGNLGAMLRCADGAGVSGVFVCDRGTDINNPNVIRSSVGTLFARPVIEMSTGDLIPILTKHKIQIVIASPHSDITYWDVSYLAPTAIVVGSEQYGVSNSWQTAANACVSIPMYGAADSLNVATAAAILLYEAVRQRSVP